MFECGMNTVTKKEIIDRLTESSGLRRPVVRDLVEAALQGIFNDLAAGRRLELRDFGVLEIRRRAGRTAQNPKTLERVVVPPRRTVKFKPGRLLRDALLKLDLAELAAPKNEATHEPKAPGPTSTRPPAPGPRG
jgi:integration host factor subunit beta